MSALTTIDFHGDAIVTVERQGERFVALKPIVEALGLDRTAQQRRVNRDQVLSEGSAIMALPSAKGTQETLCLRLDLLNGWLFTIDANRVRDEIRDKIILYQRECYRALAAHFAPKPVPVEIPTIIADLGLATLTELNVKRQLVAEARQTKGLAAARALWDELGLPGCGPAGSTPARGEDIKAELLELLAEFPEGLHSLGLNQEMRLRYRRSPVVVDAALNSLVRQKRVKSWWPGHGRESLHSIA